MATLRSTLITLGTCSLIALSGTNAFARGGGGRGGGGGGGGRGGGGMGGGGGGGQQPAPVIIQENPQITADRQQITTNEATLSTANTEYNKAVSAFQTDFRKHDDYVAARKALDDAQKALDAARTAVVTKLKTQDSTYQAAVTKVTASKKKLDQIRASGGSRDAISAQANVILGQDDAVAKLEQAGYDADQPCIDAKKALADAKVALDALDAKLADAVKTDDKLKALRDTKDAAQTALTDSRKKLQTDQATLK